MKKRHTLYLNPDIVEKARVHVQEILGISLSAYINWHLREFVDVAENQPVRNKKPSEMTLQEFSELMNYWIRLSDD